MADPTTEAPFEGPVVGGRYRLGDLIGQGGQGSTYRAFDREGARTVAVKVFALGKAAEWKPFELFQRECRTLRALDHPRIPHFLDELQSEDGSTYYLVMEYISGETLHQRLRARGALSEAELWQVLWQIVDVLSYLHGQSPPVVHRDIKPMNVIQRASGEIVLVDFGGVRQALRPDGGSTVVGTFGYMAPEQLHGEARPATDLYSLGATLVALGTAMEPEHLPREGLQIDFSQHLEVSPPLARLLRRLTEPEPDQRPRSGAQLKTELEHIASQGEDGDGGGAAGGSGSAAGVPPLPSDMPPQIGVAAGVLMAIIGVVGTAVVTVVDGAIVPLIFALIAIFSSPQQRKQLEAQRKKVQLALRDAQPSLKQLSSRGVREFEDNRRRLATSERKRLPRRRRRGRRTH
jgi:hypothetical protein